LPAKVPGYRRRQSARSPRASGPSAPEAYFVTPSFSPRSVRCSSCVPWPSCGNQRPRREGILVPIGVTQPRHAGSPRKQKLGQSRGSNWRPHKCCTPESSNRRAGPPPREFVDCPPYTSGNSDFPHSLPRDRRSRLECRTSRKFEHYCDVSLTTCPQLRRARPDPSAVGDRHDDGPGSDLPSPSPRYP